MITPKERLKECVFSVVVVGGARSDIFTIDFKSHCKLKVNYMQEFILAQRKGP